MPRGAGARQWQEPLGGNGQGPPRVGEDYLRLRSRGGIPAAAAGPGAALDFLDPFLREREVVRLEELDARYARRAHDVGGGNKTEAVRLNGCG
jgi:hypothetical protein